MGIMDSVKSRLGFGDAQDPYDDYDDYDDEGYDSDEYDQKEGRAYGSASRGGRVGSYANEHNSSVRVVSRSSSDSYSSRYRSHRDRDARGYDVYDSGVQDRDVSEPEFLRYRGTSSQSGLGSYHRSNYNAAGSSRRGTAAGYSSASGSYGGSDYRASSQTASRSRRSQAPAPDRADSWQGYPGSRDRYSAPTVAGSSQPLAIIRPVSYDDAEGVSEAFKNGRSVVISLVDTRPELARRILDFSFGVASALSGRVERIGNRVFLIAHGSTNLTDMQLRQLRDAGIRID